MDYLPAKGLNTDITWNGPTSEVDSVNERLLQESGALWTRLDANWVGIETSHGVHDTASVAELDSAVDAISEFGCQMLFFIASVPQWANGSTNQWEQPTDLAFIADFCTWLATRYGDRVKAFEIWNEPNIAQFWPSGPSASEYAALLKVCHDAIKAVDASLTVVFAGLSMNDYAYLDDCYAAEPALGLSFDVMATHPYTAHGQPPEAVTLTAGKIDKGCFRGYLELRASMVAHGDSAKPIWITEMGWSTCSPPNAALGGVDEATQADYLTRAFAVMHSDLAAGGPVVAMVYMLRQEWVGPADDPTDWTAQLSLIHFNYTRKPAFAAFQGIPTVVPTAPSAQAALVSASRPTNCPHYAFPMRRGTVGAAATLEQDTDDEIAASIATLVSLPQGSDPLQPDLGIPEGVFLDGGPNLDEMRTLLGTQEPRAVTDPELTEPLLRAGLALVDLNWDRAA